MFKRIKILEQQVDILIKQVKELTDLYNEEYNKTHPLVMGSRKR